MTLYRESMRRLFRVGITLMALAFAASLICAIMSCGTQSCYMTSAIEMSPVLAVYAFVGGAGLAFSGLSFLNKRAESDFYHSIPVRRADLFLSVSAAAATWMLFTVVLSSATSAVVFLALGKPFAPLYPFMNAGYFFAAALLVYAAAAIGCTITGTRFTNVVLTCLVLFLPRYILFLIGRTLIADTGIMSWLDLKGFLDPTTNAATGVIVLLTRNLLLSTVVNGLGIIWSIVLALVELAVGALLFKRRPSELAEQGASNRALQIVFAGLLSLAVLLVYTARAHVATPLFTWIILVAGLACFAVYQIIVLRSAKRVLLSLPWFLCSVAAAAVIMFGSQAAAKKQLNICPAAEDIASVRFLGSDRGGGPSSYATLLTSKIEFTEGSVKACVADTLRQNIDSMNTYGYLVFDSNYIGYEPVRIKLKNGRTLSRLLLFADCKALNNSMRQNAEYRSAVQQLPPDDTVKAVFSYIDSSESEKSQQMNLNSPELYTLCEYYFGEQRADGALIPYYEHNPNRFKAYEQSGPGYRYVGYTPVNGEQTCGDFQMGGYIGTQRYQDNISITLRTPAAASYYMELMNKYAQNTDMGRIGDVYRIVREALDTQDSQYYCYFNLGFRLMNCPNADGDLQTVHFDWNMNQGDGYDSPHRFAEFVPQFEELLAILQRGTLTNDCKRVCAIPYYHVQFNDASTEGTRGNFYLAFSPEDEARLIELVGTWAVMTDARYSVQGDFEALTPEAAPAPFLPAPSPTPVPVG